MKNILSILFVVTIIGACGKSDSSEVNSRILSKELKNTYWEMPSYPAANLTILEGTGMVALNETTVISNAQISVLGEDPKEKFVVFNMFNTNENRVIGLTYIDKETIKISVISSSNSLEGYKESHSALGTIMKKKNLK